MKSLVPLSSLLLIACGGRQSPDMEAPAPLTLALTAGGGTFEVEVAADRVVLLDPGSGALVSVEDIVVDGAADVIYVGEEHDQAAHHALQTQIAQALVDRGWSGIGVEMVDWRYQHVLDEYAGGDRSERWLRRNLDWEENWGMEWLLYEPVFVIGKTYRGELLALNAPRALSARVFEVGLDGLTDEEREQLPADFDMSNAAYRSFLADALAAHGDEADADTLRRFEEAQLTWDESMAQTLAEAIQADHSRRWVIAVGSGHVRHGWGVPSRVARRVTVEDLTIVCTALGRDGADPHAEAQAAIDEAAGDLVCLSLAHPH